VVHSAQELGALFRLKNLIHVADEYDDVVDSNMIEEAPMHEDEQQEK